MDLHAWTADRLANDLLPGASYVLRMGDDAGLLPRIWDERRALAVCDVLLHDAEESTPGVFAPCAQHAQAILTFYRRAVAAGAAHFVAQCQAGVGRSVAVCGALARAFGHEFGMPYTYNRALYRAILAAAGHEPPAEPLVSLTVRVKYEVDRLALLLLSLKRQRYENWEAVCFTDGPNPLAVQCAKLLADPRIRVLQTPERLGRWGHYWRETAFAACRGEWIGTQNDDNYLTPGFLEQLVNEGQKHEADVVLCEALHRYNEYAVTRPGSDLCTWIARRRLVAATPWNDVDFFADASYLARLICRDDVKSIQIRRPLVVKN